MSDATLGVASTDPERRRFRRRLGAILLVAACVRLVYVAVIADDPLAGDAFNYATVAAAISDGRWFVEPFATPDTPSAEHPPATSVVLALAPLVIGQDTLIGEHPAYVLFQRLTLVAFGVATVGLVGWLGRRLAGESSGLVAALVAALNPNLWINDGLLMAESLAAFVTMALLIALDVARRRTPDQARWLSGWAGVGALAGLGSLVRSEALLVAAIAVLPVWWSAVRGSPKDALRSAAVAGLAGLAVAATWIGPNMARFSEPVFFSTNDGLTLLGSNCPDTYSGKLIGFWNLPCIRFADADGNGIDDWTDLQRADPGEPGPDPARESTRWRRTAFEFVGDNAGRVPVVAAARVGRIWGLYDPAGMADYNRGEGRRAVVSWLGWGWHVVATPLAVVGLVVLRRRRVSIWPIAAQAVGATVVAAAVHGVVRFRVGWDVAACIPVGVALVAAWVRRSGAARPQEPGAESAEDGVPTMAS